MTPERRLARRLLPLQVAVGLLGMMLWVPVEKLFMTEIGFTPATVGIMAAAYAAVVPVLEIPSGILADRSSRSWVMVGASAALGLSSLVGGLSHHVLTYIAAAVVLGAFFALSSGTVDSMVYDTVLEETGGSELYERWIGRVRVVESVALAVSALAGGVLAGLTSARLTYLATVPFAVVAAVAFLRFREPRLHQAEERVPVRQHIRVTFRTMATNTTVRQVLLLSAMAGLLSQAIFEFGPLWLVAVAAPAALFGPYWAALVSTLGLGGLLAGRLDLDRARAFVPLAIAMPLVTLGLALTDALAVVIAAQVLLALGLAVLAIHAGRLLHDAVPSSIRTGVSSGVGTLSWVLFLPFSLVTGWLARSAGTDAAGWLLAGAAAMVGALLVLAGRRDHVVVETAEPEVPADDVVCRELVELVMDHLDGRLADDWEAAVRAHLHECDGCTAYVAQIRQIVQALAEPGRPDAMHGPPAGEQPTA